MFQGARVSRALSEAQQTVQTTKHFAHPANWAGFLLVGADVKLSNKVRRCDGRPLSNLEIIFQLTFFSKFQVAFYLISCGIYLNFR